MGKVSKIEYVDSSWSPWIGCTPVSEGCGHCYAAAWARRAGRHFPVVTRASDAKFYEPLNWRSPKRIFVCELSDFLHEDVDMEWYTNAVEVMRRASHHTYLIVTKRIERWLWFAENWPDVANGALVGVTAESQARYDERAPILIHTVPLMRRFVSLEPLLGPVTLENIDSLAWVIVGAESGPKRRECKVEWIEDIVEQCQIQGTSVFVKQGSHRFPGRQGNIPDDLWKIKQYPHD